MSVERKRIGDKQEGIIRKGKKKTSKSLRRVHSFEEAISTASSTKAGTSQHNATATRDDNLLAIEPLPGTLDTNAASLRIVESHFANHQRQKSLAVAIQNDAVDLLHPATGLTRNATQFATSVEIPSILGGNAVASTSYGSPIDVLQSTSSPSRTEPPFPHTSYPQESFDADNPLYSFPPHRHPNSDPTIIQGTQSFNQGYNPGYPAVGTEQSHSTGIRRGWLQQEQQQQQQNQPGSLGADPPYSTLLHPLPLSTNVSEQQRNHSAFAAPSFPSGVASSNTGHEGSSILGVTDASFASSQSGYDGQQPQHQDHSGQRGQGQGSIGPVSLQRSHEHRPQGSDPSSLGSSEWSSLPNMRLLRGMQGDLLSSNTSASQLSAPSERGKRQPSRAHLQKHLRNLQSEMVALKEKVRVAENLYRGSSPGNQSTSDSSGRLFDSSFGRKTVDHFEIRDYRGDERLAQSSNEALVESSGSAYSSSFSGYPGTPWRQHPYNGGPSQTASSSSSMGAIPPRRGTWKTGAGNVLVFNTAVASDTEQSSSAQTGEANFSEQNVNDEGDEDEDAGTGAGTSDDTGKRYQCLVPGCLKSFTTSGHARRHSRTHLGHKLFVCPHEGCDSTFTRRDNCRQHQRARHHMTLLVPELTENETLENLILDRQQNSSRQVQRDANIST